MEVINIDHIVLTVRDIEASVAFYQSTLGMSREEFAEGRVALKYGNQKINLHPYGNEFSPHAESPQPGSADLCFIINGSIEQAMIEVKTKGIELEEGPVTRTGAKGPITSFYIRDPDGNLIELSSYDE